MKYLIGFAFFLCHLMAFAQQDSLPVYFIEEEEVVLEFDIRDYEDGKDALFSDVLEIEGLDILEITKPPYFWTQNDWKLLRVKEHIFQLRKELEKCDDVLPWIDRYVLKKESYSAGSERSNESESSVWYNRKFKNRKMVGEISEDGNVSFKLSGYLEAKEVILSGNFNGWNTSAIKMRRNEKGWFLKMDFPQGTFEYKFIVDGEWIHDPDNSRKIINEHNTFNSILLVGDYIVFKLPQNLDAKQVILSGSFNDWDTRQLQMEKSSDAWFVEVPLSPGKHLYKFIVDGEWLLDPVNQLSQVDKEGNVNSVLLIH